MNKDEPVFLELFRAVIHNLANRLPDKCDEMRFGQRRGTPAALIKEWCLKIINSFGFIRFPLERQAWILENLDKLQVHASEWAAVSRLFADDESRKLLVSLLAYRILGYRQISLPLRADKRLREFREKEASLLVQANVGTLRMGEISWPINRYDLRPAGYDSQIEAQGLTNTFFLEQYRFNRENCPEIGVREGDMVVDGGGCMGDTAIYGACRAKETGRVFCFEFDVNNLVWLKRNLDLNPAIKPRIQVMPFALWDRSGESVIIDGEGPSARIMAGTEGRTVQSMAIDDLVTKGTTARIDFIKLDIEGAELRALKGAEMVLQQFRPRLAISVYHHEDDMWEIPLWINSLGLGYRFYLEHFTTHLEETVLFAIAEETADL